MDASSSSVVGREPELEILDDALARLAHGGSAFVVRGEPGIGKSALLEELCMLLSECAVRSPVLVLADDLQWLDSPTCEVLAPGGVPTPADLAATEAVFFALLERPEAQARIASLFERGLQTRGDLELNIGDRIGPVVRP